MHQLRRFFILVVAALAFFTANAQQNAEPAADWLIDAADKVCHGHYVIPKFDDSATSQGSTITADKTQLVPDGMSEVEGHVLLQQPGRRVFTDRAKLYRNASTGKINMAHLDGHVLLETPQYRLLGDSADINLTRQKAVINAAHFRIYPQRIRGHAKKITQRGKRTTDLKEAFYTTCPPGINSWQVHANILHLNHVTGQGLAKGASVQVKGVPIFYAPIFPFPVGKVRHSGFLAPHYANTSRSGREFIIPFYLNIAPATDDTVSLHLLQQRGVQIENQWRYLSKHFNGEWYLAGLPFDRKFHDFRRDHVQPNAQYLAGDPRLTALQGARPRRFASSFSNNSQFNNHFSGAVKLHYVSDDDYLVDLAHRRLLATDRQLERSAYLNYSDKHWNVRTNVEGYQTLQPFDAPVIEEPYQRLPQLVINSDYFFGYNRPHFQLTSRFTRFHHRGDPRTNQRLTQGKRFHLHPELSIPWRKPYGYFTPKIALDATVYDLDLGEEAKLNNKPSHVNRVLPIASVDTGLWFERQFNLAQKPYIHTLEPRLFYLYVPYDDQNALPNFDSSLNTFTIHQLFATNRFNSIDRIGDANQLSMAFTSRIIAEQTGRELLWGQLGQRYYFRKRSVTLCDTEIDPSCRLTENLLDPKGNQLYTPLIAEVGLVLPEHWGARAEAQWDLRTHRIEKYALGLQYWADANHLFNFSYYGADDTKPISDLSGESISQIDSSFIWQVHEKWRFLGRWHYDVQKHFAYNVLGGIEYNSCCWALRVGAHRRIQLNNGNDRQYANTFFMQIVLKGLSGVGVDPSLEFKENIPGYENRFTH